MTNDPANLENTAFLVSELETELRLLYEILDPLAQQLLSGRAPASLPLEATHARATELCEAMQASVAQLKAQPPLSPVLSENEALQNLLREISPQNWEDLQRTIQSFLGRIALLKNETQFTPLGRMAIEDAWLDIQELSEAILKRED